MLLFQKYKYKEQLIFSGRFYFGILHHFKKLSFYILYRKEILAISLVLALGMQFLCHMLRRGARLERVDSLSFGRVSTQESVFEDTSGGAENQPKEYKSR